ncbi:hypothetical protein GOP47_0020111 [Adiantum capillus-veneris]|uniref:Pentatricopeptide repeat-containing protein n=1 Tax=Adiantum capillus-veneris TaxID=13818 RepID=A0A9D4UDX6_ADICA|nr:hypothetical protein GOP47_0020111 [Adiantum capillus-veneris]
MEGTWVKLAKLNDPAELPLLEGLLSTLCKCRDEGNLAFAMQAHMHICSFGLDTHEIVGNHVIPMFVNCGCLPAAFKAFMRLQHRNVYSWTALMHGLAQCGKWQDILKFYKGMKVERVNPCSFTIVALLKACAGLKDAETAQDIHIELSKTGHECVYVGHADYGTSAEALQCLEQMWVDGIHPDVITFVSVLKVCANTGQNFVSINEPTSNSAVEAFEEMQKEGVKPDTTTFLCLLAACSRASLVHKGQEYFQMMRENCAILPNLGHLMCVVDMYARSGQINEHGLLLFGSISTFKLTNSSLLGYQLGTQLQCKESVRHKKIQVVQRGYLGLQMKLYQFLWVGDTATIQPHVAWTGLAKVLRLRHEIGAAFDGDEMYSRETQAKAYHTLQQAVEENPHDPMQWQQLGLYPLCTLQFRMAQSCFKMAIALRQTCGALWSNLGISLQLSEELVLAEEVYQKALSLVPQEGAHAILSNLGNLYRQQRHFTDAHAAFQKALNLCPNDAPACNNLGLLLVMEGKLDEAMNMFDCALQSDAAKSNRMKAQALARTRANKAMYNSGRVQE